MAVKIDIGIAEDDRKAIAEGLSRLLADTYTLYLKTHNYHWNVTGPMFNTLHTMFEQQYTELAAAVDEIAERIRALGFPAPGRSEEHTSELQSLMRISYAVFCLKKKTNNKNTKTNTIKATNNH